MESKSSPIFRLFGFAGTGKTTLARIFAENVEGHVAFGAFTGKAAYVLRQKGCPGATTIHQHIYIPRDRSRKRLLELEEEYRKLKEACTDPETGEIEPHQRLADLTEMIYGERKHAGNPMFELNQDSLIQGAKLVVIDECSMVDKTIGEDLLSFGVPILVLGDPAQLPPVYGTGFFTDAEPDFMLTDIHRQAKDSPIIQLATSIRQGDTLTLGKYGESRVMKREDFNKTHALAADQLIVGRNQTRNEFNVRFRQLRGAATQLPEEGDRIICLRNDHEVGLLNGAQYEVRDILPETLEEQQLILSIRGCDDGAELDVSAHRSIFLQEEVPWWSKKDAQEFDYAYAVTCHKAQGSQWENVLVFDESRCFGKDRKRWLYTAVTRASEQVTVVV